MRLNNISEDKKRILWWAKKIAQYNEKIAAKMLKTIKVKKQSLYKKGKI